ncbi:Uncharacterized protein TCM_018065 [Theobroma cacao]|uniref:Uncharacterized protein n=1 Tax=Theobroma cacao TaxID=3641 RepID=A0A061EEC2_THECC|nr:Uncharacterized protein TCM_018065 [Theobroma cacao]
MQQEYNNVPFETPSLLGASAEQVENETSTHDSRRSPSTDLAGTEERQNKSRKARQNRLTPKEGSIPKHIGGSVPFVVHAKRMAIELKRDVSFLEVFNRTHKHLGGHGDFIDNKSKSTSKYGEDSSSQPEFDSHAWTEAIGGMETTRTHVYGFGTQVPAIALLTGHTTM